MTGERLAGKRVLITGTGGGQGEAAQRLFAREGARVAGCDLRGAEESARALREQGWDVSGHTVDLSDNSSAAAWVEAAVSELGGIDVLYNNAAGYGFAPFGGMSLELWRHVMAVELDIVFHTTSAAWGPLCAEGGSLINTASYSALRGIEPLGQVAHAAAKGGVISMTRALAAEGARYGVRANSIAPGFVSSPATDGAVDPQGRAWQLGNHLIQRPGTGDDIAYMALYLASDESSWVTGQNYSVDGGATAGWRDDAETDRIRALYS
ncbi:SDR family NAD(P)-dependent oxidoreductase [Microbacterium sp. RD1]|uniref:SDR family NAD(P)-dependent oxidoreductase n=1 Tax=Microbacterium sp. RD1 TaxID=3457313 RepID=UPI003FA55762